jgi:DNA processing protein
LVGEVAGAGVAIVSGFMYGIDALAHKAALRVGGRTIAVMPCGIDLVHPAYQQGLYNEILENNGLVVSEYEGAFLPTLWSYPKRNRIVAGLCQATMVVEAGEKSGSLITANFAKKFGRKVFAVPGPLTSSVSVGIMQLIKEGASVVTSAKDILDFYRSHCGFSFGFTPLEITNSHGQNNVDAKNLQQRKSLTGFTPHLTESSIDSSIDSSISSSDSLEQKILEQLQAEPVEVDMLARMLGVSIGKIGSALSLLELSGAVTKEGSTYYVA